MPNPFTKGWNYLMASFDKKVDDSADPKVLVHQAMNEAKEQHKNIQEQAASVIGQTKQLELSMSKSGQQLDETQGQIRQTLQLADSARAEGDPEKATRLDGQAEQLANRLVTLEQELEHTKELHMQSVQNAEQAKQAVKESETRLKDTLAQQDQLLMQAQQAEMQQQSAQATSQLSAAAESSAPTMDQIREKIESRYTTALGQQELAEATGTAQTTASFDAAQLERDTKSRSKLDEIRSSMGLGAGSSTDTTAIEQGAGAGAPEDGGSASGEGRAPSTGDAGASDDAGAADGPATTDEPGANGDSGAAPADGSNPTLPRDTRE